MKKTFLLLFPLILILGCSKSIDESSLNQKGKLSYLPDSNIPYSGKVHSSYSTGEKKYTGEYDNGLLISYSFFNKDGSIKEAINALELVIRSKIFYLKNESEPYNGEIFGLHENGESLFQGSIKNGKKEGKWTYNTQTGNGNYSLTYTKGTYNKVVFTDNLGTSYECLPIINLTREDGRYLYQEQFELNRNEIAEELDVKASKMVKEFFQASGVVDNAQELEFTESVSKQIVSQVDEYDFTRYPKIYCTYKYGEEQGLWIEWYENGWKKKRGNYKDGIKLELWAEWHNNGQKKEEGIYMGEDGMGVPFKELKWIEWHNNGQKKREGNYRYGYEQGVWTEWYNNGQKREEGNYKDGRKEVIWIEWHNNGQKQLTGEYISGKRNGLWIEWHENGQKKEEGHYKTEDYSDIFFKYGKWTFWNKDGQKEKEGRYSSGSENGLWTKWYDNGRKKEEGRYIYGKENGLWTKWYDNGRKKEEGVYGENTNEQLIKVGKWTYYNKDGSVKEVKAY